MIRRTTHNHDSVARRALEKLTIQQKTRSLPKLEVGLKTGFDPADRRFKFPPRNLRSAAPCWIGHSRASLAGHGYSRAAIALPHAARLRSKPNKHTGFAQSARPENTRRWASNTTARVSTAARTRAVSRADSW
jgi:hypothetical protein